MVLVTGGTGFIGSRVLKKLIDDGFDVAATARESTDFSRVQDIRERVLWVGAGADELQEFFVKNKVDAVVHMATSYGRKREQFFDVYETNVSFALNLMKMAAENGCRLFVNTDSFSVNELGDCLQVGVDVHMNAYHKSKFMFREIARDNISMLDMAFANMQLQHIYGPGDCGGKFVLFMMNELSKETPEIELTEGLQQRDWTYVDDAASAYSAVLKNMDGFKPGSFNEFQVGTGVATSLRDFCIKLKDAMNSSSELCFGRKEMQRGELMTAKADNASLKALGWEIEVDLDEGIRRLIQK